NLLILLLLVILSGATAYSQVPPAAYAGGMGSVPKSGVIKGKIVDGDSKSPMEYANVAVFSKKDSSLVSGGIADAQGLFEVSGLPFGMYYVEANFIGFEKTTIPEVRLIPNASTVNMGTIELAVESKSIGAVDVIADRNRIEYKIDKKVINVSQDINAAGGTAVTVLENTPSVEVDIDGNVSLRGSSSFTVLIDGRPSVLGGSDALKQIPSSAIENIEIITNPSVKYDPDGMAGIINIVMKKNILSGFNGIINTNIGTGDKYGADLTMNYKTKKYNIFFGANWNDNTDEGSMRSSRETYRNDTTTYLTNEGKRNQIRGGTRIQGGFEYFLSDKTSVTLSGETGEYNFDGEGGGRIHKYQFPVNPAMDIYSIQENNSFRNGKFVEGSASFLSKFDESGTHKLEGSFEYQNRNGESGDNTSEFLSESTYTQNLGDITRVVTTETEESEDYRMKIDYTRPFESGGKLEAGVQSRLEREIEIFNFTNFGINDPKYTSDMDFKEDIHSIYSTLSGKLNPVQYQLGLRGEYTKRSIAHSLVTTPYTLDRFDYFPSAHFSLDMNENNQLMTSYSRRINRPGGRDLDPFPSYMNQYTIRLGNPDLKPEYTDSYELSLMRKFGNSFLSLETFYRTTSGKIERSMFVRNDTSYMQSFNLERDHSMGGELMGNINVTKWLLLNTSLTLYKYKMEGELLGRIIDRQSTNYSGRMNATVKFSPDSRLQLTGYYRGPSVSAQGDQESMLFTNVSYRHEFMKKKLTATLSLRDAFGTAKFEGTSVGDDFRSSFRMQREPRVFMLTLSYKINNYKMEREGPQEQAAPGGGDDDMF
ncbi:MAG TPA: TonB-dependent receptor, partial [Prolixibacteraceae bacterium]|nr:TonB-dependent receptor [Prolixibacteraceae bacterium]